MTEPSSAVPVLLAAIVLLAVPFAGCVGGESQTGPSRSDVETVDPSAGDGADEAVPTGERPHVHDRWKTPDGAETDRIVLVDREVRIDPVGPQHPGLVQQCRQIPPNGAPVACLGQATFDPEATGEGTSKIVPPGTQKVEVTLSWDGGFEEVRFYYQDRMSNGRWESLGTFESGDTMAIRPVPVQISDDGHAHVSHWRFHVEPMGNPYPAGDDDVWYGQGSIDVDVVAHRQDGPLPREPAHPDFWVDTDTYRIGSLQGQVSSFVHAGRLHAEEGGCGTSPAGRCTPLETNSKGILWTIRPGYPGTRLTSAEAPDPLQGEFVRALVPPGAKMLGVRMAVEGSSDAPVEVCLRAMDAPSEGPYGVVVSCRSFDGGEVTWTETLAISPREVDSFYTDNTGVNASRWSFVVQVRAPTDLAGAHGAGHFEGAVQADVFVSRSTDFAVPAWADGGQTR